MRVPKIKFSNLPTFAAALFFGCVEIQEPAPPQIDYSQGINGRSATCSCVPEEIEGRAFRFTELRVDQPALLAITLDRMWKYEIGNYLLNVIFTVREAESDVENVTAFSKLSLRAGTGWRIPETGYLVDENFTGVTSFHFMDDSLNVDLEMTPVNGEQCTLKNERPATLYFHLGPLSDPLMCGPLLTPANSTPINDLYIILGFNADCTRIEGGSLEGCIPQYAADRICLCSQAGTCLKSNANPETPLPAGPTVRGESYEGLDRYCAEACGTKEGGGLAGWATFRGILDSADIAPTCITAEGEIGYRLSARFSAEDISSLFVSTAVDP